MVLIPAKQVRKLIDAPLVIRNFAPAGSDDNITSQLTTLLGTAGDGGRPVPVQPATTGMGVVLGKCRLGFTGFGDTITFNAGNPVHGVLTHANGIFTITYFEQDFSGTTSPVSFPAGQFNIDIELFYRFDFALLPAAALSSSLERINTASGPYIFWELLEVTATNTLSSLSDRPTDAESIWVIVNGISYDLLSPDPAFSFDLNTGVITWNAANAGFSLEASDRVIAYYQ